MTKELWVCPSPSQHRYQLSPFLGSRIPQLGQNCEEMAGLPVQGWLRIDHVLSYGTYLSMFVSCHV